MSFSWDELRRDEAGKIKLLYRHQRIFDEGLIRPDLDVLDVGGWGMLASAVIETGARCTILDLFTTDQYYAERVRSMTHKAGDVRDASNFKAKSFDVVTCFETLEHCGDIDAALTNMKLWLRRGGWLVGTMPLPTGGCHHEGEEGISFLNVEQLEQKLRDLKLQSVKVEPTTSVNFEDSVACSIYFKGKKP